MLAAILRGKISSRTEGSEDLLTSIVFGILEHIEPSLWFELLCKLIPSNPPPIKPAEITKCCIQYWPPWSAEKNMPGAEPDVVLWFTTSSDKRIAIIVEVKRTHGKSGHGKQDQLARQAQIGRSKIAKCNNTQLAGIIYLTSHIIRPDTDITDSQKASLKHFGCELPPVWWLSWRDIAPLLQQIEKTHKDPIATQARQAAECLQKWGLVRFQGLGDLPKVIRFGEDNETTRRSNAS